VQLRETRERKALLQTELAETPRYRPVLDESGEPLLGGVDRLAQAQQELIRLRGRYSENHPEVIALRREIEALSTAPANQANLAQQLRADLAARREELAAARETYSDSHPDVIRLQRTVRSLEEQLDGVAGQIATASPSGPIQPNNPVYLQLLTRIDTADAELADLNSVRNDLTARIAELDRRGAEAPQVERNYAELTQEQELLLLQYRELRGLGSEATLAQNLESGDSGQRLTVIEPPRVASSPVSPNRASITFLGIVLALAIGFGVASLIESTDTKVRGQRDIQAILEMPPLAIVPYVENAADRRKRLTINFAMGGGLLAATAFVVTTALA
jgi:uncharacterized protein involved in exopolysaccharide biosynthesis